MNVSSRVIQAGGLMFLFDLTCRVTRPANNCLLWARVLPSGFSCLELGTFPTYSEARARFNEL